jgi:hypothetical protein
MVLGFFTVIIMGICAYAFWREGPLTAFACCVNVLVSGMLAFNFFEPIADLIEPLFKDSFLEGIEDALAMMLVFLPALALFRWLTNSLASTHMEYPPVLYRGGALLFGLVAGYLLSGFLACMMQTLPLQRDFLGFEPYEAGVSKSPVRKFLPPDVVWLAMMYRMSGTNFAGIGDVGAETRFDRGANFELRYARYRRWHDKPETLPDQVGKPLIWHGELDP